MDDSAVIRIVTSSQLVGMREMNLNVWSRHGKGWLQNKVSANTRGVTRRTARTTTVHTAEFHGRPVTITRKSVKNMYLRIQTKDGRIAVTAPFRISDGTIRDFIENRWDWIEQAERELGEARSAAMESGTKQVWSTARKNEARQRMNAVLPALLNKWLPIVGREPSNISLRLMTTRWGSCTPATRRIRLNLELAWLEPELLEYVLVHELTHLWASGHGATFQRYMTAFMPDWKQRRRTLNHHIIG
ncbi:M48 family metallopeptidase [Bifidobacterium aquikefiricola]|uniref:SprT family zinc-dependent metalloprotease n=1 Tax=Bifidobacterium aquikefiricola TaxID=3059038 RepID=A0AB39U6W5_9BIFI